MAAPNIVGVTTIVGLTTGVNVTTTPTVFLTNSSDSGQVLKVNSIIVSNVDGTNAANVFVKLHQQAAGAGTSFSLAHEISVAADSTLVLMDKASSIYLEENKSLVSYASANSDLDIVCSFERISA